MAQVRLTPVNARQLEGGIGTTRSFTFRLERIGESLSAGDVTWTVAGVGGPGTLGIDIDDFAVVPSGVTSFALGQTEAELTILIAGDAQVEFNERFVISVESLPAGDTIEIGSATGIVLSDDASFSIGAIAAHQVEDSGEFTFMIYRDGAANSGQTVDWSVSGTASAGLLAADAADFVGGVLPSGTVSFAPGEFRKPVTVQVAADSSAEQHEGFAVTLSNPAEGARIGRATAAGSILNDDGARYSIAADTRMQREGDGTPTAYGFTVTRTGSATAAQTLDWSVSGGGIPGTVGAVAADFAGGVLPSGSITFAAGETRQTITLETVGDELAELNESFTVTLANPSAGAALGRATASAAILDDDAIIQVTGPEQVFGTEGNDVFLIGPGTHEVVGLGGSDTFLLSPGLRLGEGPHVTVVADFDAAAGDRFNLSLLDAISATEEIDAFTFIGTAAFSGTAGELAVIDIGSGLQMIAGDVDGDSGPDFGLMVALPPAAEASWLVL